MWRFIIVTFAFLGFAFYELSGGADYAPATDSIQARAKLNDVRPLARPLSEVPDEEAVAAAAVEDIENAPTVTENGAEEEQVSRAMPTLDDVDLPEDSLELALAEVTATDAGSDPVGDLAADATLASLLEDGTNSSLETADMRRVTGSVVNMRDGPSTFYLVVGQLREGDAVEVLEASGDGWLKVLAAESGQEGWMADWLVTAAH